MYCMRGVSVRTSQLRKEVVFCGFVMEKVSLVLFNMFETKKGWQVYVARARYEIYKKVRKGFIILFPIFSSI